MVAEADNRGLVLARFVFSGGAIIVLMRTLGHAVRQMIDLGPLALAVPGLVALTMSWLFFRTPRSRVPVVARRLCLQLRLPLRVRAGSIPAMAAAVMPVTTLGAFGGLVAVMAVDRRGTLGRGFHRYWLNRLSGQFFDLGDVFAVDRRRDRNRDAA